MNRLCFRFFVVVAVNAQFMPAESVCATECIVALELPRATDGLPRVWLPEGQEGVVHIRVKVDRTGAVENVTTMGATTELRVFSERWIRESKFNPLCAGRVIELVYAYHIYTEPIALHLPSVTIETGNRFVLSFPALRPYGPMKQIITKPK